MNISVGRALLVVTVTLAATAALAEHQGRDLYLTPYADLQAPAAATSALPSGFVAYTVKAGDTLESIALNTLGSPSYAFDIARLNNLRGEAATKLAPGQNLLLPIPRVSVQYALELYDRNECEFRVVPTSYTFHSGDRVRIRLRANADGFVYVYNVGTSGTASVLFPDARINGGKNELRRQRELLIPDTRWFEFNEQAGKEQLYVFFSRRPIDGQGFVASDEALASEGWNTVMATYKGAADHATRDLVLGSTSVPASGYVSAQLAAQSPFVAFRIELDHRDK